MNMLKVNADYPRIWQKVDKNHTSGIHVWGG